jgi:hypothetical protein
MSGTRTSVDETRFAADAVMPCLTASRPLFGSAQRTGQACGTLPLGFGFALDLALKTPLRDSDTADDVRRRRVVGGVAPAGFGQGFDVERLLGAHQPA